MGEFTIERVSPAGDVPAITFHVRGDTMRAEMANGAKLYAEAGVRGEEPIADLRIECSDGQVLADILVRRTTIDETITEHVASVGAALLWSHWRFVEADKRWCEERDRNLSTNPNPAPPLNVKHSEACPYCDVAAGVDCAIHPAFGKLYDGCERRMATKKSMRELIAKSSIGAGLADIKERGIDAHLADVEEGKF